MSEFEIRAGALSIRLPADDEVQAITDAYELGLLVDGDEGNVYEAENIPVGLDGDDPEA